MHSAVIAREGRAWYPFVQILDINGLECMKCIVATTFFGTGQPVTLTTVLTRAILTLCSRCYLITGPLLRSCVTITFTQGAASFAEIFGDPCHQCLAMKRELAGTCTCTEVAQHDMNCLCQGSQTGRDSILAIGHRQQFSCLLEAVHRQASEMHMYCRWR